jgi:hypothetical protein
MESQLPSPDQALNTIAENVRANVFFTKLAQRGIQPRNENEAVDLLKLADDLRIVAQDTRVKQAMTQEVPSPYAAARDSLHTYLRGLGLDTSLKSANDTESNIAIRNYAAQLAKDPAIFGSVLSIKAAEATAIGQRIGFQFNESQPAQ